MTGTASLNLAPKDRQTLKESVIIEIKRAIFDGRLQPGQRLNEAQLAVDLGLSKAPIREAINELVSLGFLTSRPYKGARVKNLSRNEAEELYSLRSVLESFAAERAAPRLTEDDLASFEDLVERIDTAVKEQDSQAMVELDLRFHQFLVQLSGHRILMEMWARIYDRLTIYMLRRRVLFNAAGTLTRLHRDLLDELKSGDPDRIKNAVTKHINHYAAKALELFSD